LEAPAFGRLTDRTADICIDMQNVSPRRHLAYALVSASASGRRTHCRAPPVADDLYPPYPAMPARPDTGQLAALLRELTLERINPRLIDLVPPLAALAPPTEVIDKRVYSPFSEPKLSDLLRRRRIDGLVITGAETDVCVLDAFDLGYRVVLATDAVCSSADAAHDALLTLCRTRLSQQMETASSETILACWY
jgi:nicotinamidase-related amidase